MKTLPKLFLLLLLTLSIQGYAQAVQKTDSGYVFSTILPKNTGYKFRVTILTDMETTKDGSTESSELDMTMDFGFKVKKQEPEFSLIEYKFTRMTMVLSGRGYTLDLDSDRGPTGNPKIDKVNQKLKSEIKKRKTVEKVWRDGRSESVGETAQSELASSVDYDWANFFYRSGAIKIGDSWSKTGTKKLSGEDYTVNMTYELVEVNEETSVFSVSADLYKSEESNYDRGTITGSVIIDNTTGYCTRQNLDVRLSMGENSDKLHMTMSMEGSKK